MIKEDPHRINNRIYGVPEVRVVGEDIEAGVYRFEDALRMAQEKGLEFTCFLEPATPTRLRGDPERLRQVLVNLLGNAIKFTQRGNVDLHAEPVQDHEGVVRIRFSVSDTGIGIPPENQVLIFDAFSQADRSTSRKYGGTGLGLTISRHLTELMGGTSPCSVNPAQGVPSRSPSPSRPRKTPAQIPSATGRAFGEQTSSSSTTTPRIG